MSIQPRADYREDRGERDSGFEKVKIPFNNLKTNTLKVCKNEQTFAEISNHFDNGSGVGVFHGRARLGCGLQALYSMRQTKTQIDRELQMADHNHAQFNAAMFLAQAGLGRKVVQVKPKHPFFSQGEPADCIYYLQSGRAKLTVISKEGKEATIALLAAGDFVGEESLAGTPGLRLATATAIVPCTALKIERAEMVRVLHQEHTFSDLFLKFLLARGMRMQADLVDQLFNSSEKRLARFLLLMAEFGKPDNLDGGKDHPPGSTNHAETLIPKISQEALAEMIGTTRSRVSFFMNRFRKLGFIDYNGGIKVHKSLLNVVLHD